MKCAILVLTALLLPCAASAQTAVVVVRHAERADAGMMSASSADPELSSSGRARAESLAAMLKDTRITGIFVTEFKRTVQTAAPLAKLLGIEPTVIGSKDVRALTDRISSARGNVLVVGHSNTIPAVVKALGVTEDVVIGDAEFDHMLVVVRGSSPSLLRFRYR